MLAIDCLRPRLAPPDCPRNGAVRLSFSLGNDALWQVCVRKLLPGLHLLSGVLCQLSAKGVQTLVGLAVHEVLT